jgi:hypothetical protein
MCVKYYGKHICGHLGAYRCITICAYKQDTESLIRRGIARTHGQIRSNRVLCVRDSSINWTLVDTKCTRYRQRDEEELGKMGMSYIMWDGNTAGSSNSGECRIMGIEDLCSVYAAIGLFKGLIDVIGHAVAWFICWLRTPY